MSGEAKPGRLLVIMGPSGSGKTTLLNVLAGQLAASPRLSLSGHLDVNDKPRSSRTYKYAIEGLGHDIVLHWLHDEPLLFSGLLM